VISMPNIKDNNILNIKIVCPNYTELKKRLSRNVSLDEAKGEGTQNNKLNIAVTEYSHVVFYLVAQRAIKLTIVIVRVIKLSFLELSVLKLTLIKLNAFKLMVVVTKKLISYSIFKLT
jgi:hypothetical protein